MTAALLLAFTAGMVAAFNPCGFALLPGYIGAYIAADDVATRMDQRIRRALRLAATMSIGFSVVFTAIGFVIELVSEQLRDVLPWVTILVGALLVMAGVLMMAGWKPNVRIPVPALGRTGSKDARVIGYGAVFAIASLSCTIGPFLAVTGAALTVTSAASVLTYVAYALGMGFMVFAIGVVSSVAHDRLAHRLRSVSRAVSRIGGGLMALAGAYVIWYGRWELRVLSGRSADDPLIDAVEALRGWLVQGVERIGAVPLALLIVLGVGVGLAARRRSADIDAP